MARKLVMAGCITGVLLNSALFVMITIELSVGLSIGLSEEKDYDDN